MLDITSFNGRSRWINRAGRLKENWISRRAFVKNGSLILFGTGVFTGASPVFESDDKKVLRFGLITDLHYADKAPAGSRHYRETLDKLAAADAELDNASPGFLTILGDTIDSADNLETEKTHLDIVYKRLKKLPGEKTFLCSEITAFTC